MLKLITPPTIEPISLSELKAHLRIDGTDEDALLNAIIKTAREHVEAITRRALIQQTWQLILDGWWLSGAILELPMPPLISVESIVYKDSAGTEYTLESNKYLYDATDIGRLMLADGESFPTSELYPMGAVKITF